MHTDSGARASQAEGRARAKVYVAQVTYIRASVAGVELMRGGGTAKVREETVTQRSVPGHLLRRAESHPQVSPIPKLTLCMTWWPFGLRIIQTLNNY